MYGSNCHAIFTLLLAVHLKQTGLWQNRVEAGTHANYDTICTIKPTGMNAKSELLTYFLKMTMGLRIRSKVN